LIILIILGEVYKLWSSFIWSGFVGYFRTLSVTSLCRVKSNDHWWMMNWKRSERKRWWPCRVTIPAFSLSRDSSPAPSEYENRELPLSRLYT
jgi:hypothetical protein